MQVCATVWNHLCGLAGGTNANAGASGLPPPPESVPKHRPTLTILTSTKTSATFLKAFEAHRTTQARPRTHLRAAVRRRWNDDGRQQARHLGMAQGVGKGGLGLDPAL